MFAKTIDLNFDLKNEREEPIGNAGDTCGNQMDASEYIKRIRNEHGNEHPIVLAMIRARDQAIVEPHELVLSNDEFDIVRNWLVSFSGFMEPHKTQLLNAFDAA